MDLLKYFVKRTEPTPLMRTFRPLLAKGSPTDNLLVARLLGRAKRQASNEVDVVQARRHPYLFRHQPFGVRALLPASLVALHSGTRPGGRLSEVRRLRQSINLLDGRTLIQVRQTWVYADGRSRDVTWRSEGNHRLPWVPHLEPELPLYQVERLANLQPSADVVVCQSERTADWLIALGVAAVATRSGPLGTPSREALTPLLRYRTILWTSDDAGAQLHMWRIGRRLHSMGHQQLGWLLGHAANQSELRNLLSTVSAVPTRIRGTAIGASLPRGSTSLLPAPVERTQPRLTWNINTEFRRLRKLRRELEAILGTAAGGSLTFEDRVRARYLQQHAKRLALQLMTVELATSAGEIGTRDFGAQGEKADGAKGQHQDNTKNGVKK